MTDRELLVSLQSQIIMHLGAPVPTPRPDPVTPVDTVPVPPPPSPPAGSNPFIAWKAEGLTLYDVILYRLHHGLNAAEWEQAVAAGYESEAGKRPTGGGPAMPEGTDLTGTEGGGGRRNNFLPYTPKTFTITVTRSGPAYFTVETSPGEMTATRVSLNDEWRDLHEWQRYDFVAIAGHTHTLAVMFDGKATAAITVRYG